MKKHITIIVFILISINISAQNQEAQKKFEKEIKQYFKNTSYKTSELVQDLLNEKIYEITVNDMFYGYTILTSAKGRIDYFDFMVIYNTNKEIEYIKVLIYRSQYGYEIMNKNWLKQFYNNLGNFSYGRDIQAISGATYSANSITEKINEINSKIINLSMKKITTE